MMSPQMGAPQSMLNAAITSDPESIFDYVNDVTLEQERHYCKPCLPGCIGPIKFNAKTLAVSTATEEADWCSRNCCYFMPLCERSLEYRYDVGITNALTYKQNCKCICFSGHPAEIFSPKLGQVGSVGMPRTCCNCENGMKQCCFDVATCCSPCILCQRVHVCAYLCCTGCRLLPSRIYDANDNLLYTASAKCCQAGVFPGRTFPCDSCQTIHWEVETMQDQEMSKIIWRNNSECLGLRPSALWRIEYVPTCNRRDRELIFAATLALHSLYFDH